VIKSIAKEVFADKIYPEPEDYRQKTNDFFQREHAEFYEGLTRKRWKTYYEKNIHNAVIIKNINFFIDFIDFNFIK
jgi:hypothetical protein